MFNVEMDEVLLNLFWWKILRGEINMIEFLNGNRFFLFYLVLN